MGAAAKVDTNVTKKPSQLQWKASMWGRAKLATTRDVDLCSASTGSENWASWVPAVPQANAGQEPIQEPRQDPKKTLKLIERTRP